MAYRTFDEIEEESQKITAARLKKELQLLTSKEGIVLANSNDRQGQSGELPVKFSAMAMNIREELDGAGFSDEERKELGLGRSKLPELIKLAYETLGLITFFTTGEDESRAWTIKNGATAPEAAGVIHSDFEAKFIRADVISWDKLLEAGGWAEAKTKGIVQTVGREYIVSDGDVMIVKHGA